MCGIIAQLVEHRTGIAEVMGSNPVEAFVVVLEEGGTRRRKKTHTLIARVQREVE